jgi:hypothetical protein
MDFFVILIGLDEIGNDADCSCYKYDTRVIIILLVDPERTTE